MSLREPIFLASCIELAVLMGSATSEFRFAKCEFRYHADLVSDFLERCRGGVVTIVSNRTPHQATAQSLVFSPIAPVGRRKMRENRLERDEPFHTSTGV
jgi:hypothetical protein